MTSKLINWPMRDGIPRPLTPQEGGMLALGALVLPVAIALIALSSARVVEAEVTESGLVLSGGWYARSLTWSQLDLENARVFELERGNPLRPAKRIAGVSIPSYRSGWYRLENGDKALIFVQEIERALYLPTNFSDPMVIGLGDPDRLLEELRAGVRLLP